MPARLYAFVPEEQNLSNAEREQLIEGLERELTFYPEIPDQLTNICRIFLSFCNRRIGMIPQEQNVMEQFRMIPGIPLSKNTGWIRLVL